jgi:hypothetical protein
MECESSGSVDNNGRHRVRSQARHSTPSPANTANRVQPKGFLESSMMAIGGQVWCAVRFE